MTPNCSTGYRELRDALGGTASAPRSPLYLLCAQLM